MLVKRAEEFARLVYRNQTYSELPYYNHLKEVYLTLLDFGVKDGIVLSAVWLLGVLEDTEITYETLELQFGEEIADLVQRVTNKRGYTREQILEKTAPKVKKHYAALTIKLADRVVNTEFSIDNNLKLYEMYKKEFPRFKELLYREEEKDEVILDLWERLENLYGDEVNFENDELPRYKALELNELDEKGVKYSALEKQEVSDDWAMKLAEYREELREVERERKEDKYWNQYNQILDEREAKYYDDYYQIVEERMYDQ